MFGLFKRNKKNQAGKLAGIVSKTNQTGFLFADIMNDLASSAEQIMAHSKLTQITYGYARRTAASALYLQGLADKDGYDHNMAFFKAMQTQAEQSYKFQEQAFSDAVEFIQSYNPILTRLLMKQMVVMAETHTPLEQHISDSELIKKVLDAYASPTDNKVKDEQTPKFSDKNSDTVDIKFEQSAGDDNFPHKEYESLALLLADDEVGQAVSVILLGIDNRVSANIVTEVENALSLANYLSIQTGISAIEIVDSLLPEVGEDDSPFATDTSSDQDFDSAFDDLQDDVKDQIFNDVLDKMQQESQILESLSDLSENTTTKKHTLTLDSYDGTVSSWYHLSETDLDTAKELVTTLTEIKPDKYIVIFGDYRPVKVKIGGEWLDR